jgi:hypothetical protein
MASYRARATAIHQLVVQVRRLMEQQIDGTPSDKAAVISLAVETSNKLLYCFMLSQEMFDRIDELLNDHLEVVAEPQRIASLYVRALDVIRQLEGHAHEWVVKYAVTSKGA